MKAAAAPAPVRDGRTAMATGRPGLPRSSSQLQNAPHGWKLAEIIGAGVTLAGGSDSFIGPLDPLLSMHGAVNHIIPGQSLTPYQALRAFTLDAAYSAFEEAEKGSITPGKAADLVVLGANPLEEDPRLLKDIPVEATLVDGVVCAGTL